MQDRRHGLVSVSQEASGEIRLSLRLPGRSPRRGSQRLPAVAKRAGCAHLSIAPNSENEAASQSSGSSLPRVTIFGAYAKRSVKNACGALGRIFGKRIVFATLTLPGSTETARAAIATASKNIVERLNHWRLEIAPESLWVYKWEWQKSGALHLHAAIGSSDIRELRRLEAQFKNFCYGVYERLSESMGVDFFGRHSGGSWRNHPEVLRARIEPVRKCVKRYMSKYLVKQDAREGWHCPTRWWGQSRRLRAAARGMRRMYGIRSENWQALVEIAEYAAACGKLGSAAWFEYVERFAPHNRTMVIYEAIEGTHDIFGVLSAILAERACDAVGSRW
jgi:hypothetical protein